MDACLDLLESEKLNIEMRDPTEGFLVVVASPGYQNIVDGNPKVSKEWTSWVHKQIRTRGAQAQNILPVVLPGGSPEHIPKALRGKRVSYFTVTDFSLAGSAELLFLLFGNKAASAGLVSRLRAFTYLLASGIKRIVTLANEFTERVSNWFVWAVGGGILPLLCIWILNIKKESDLQELLGSGELFIVSAVLVAATYGELLRERKIRSGEAEKNGNADAHDAAPSDNAKKFTWPSQLSKFACFASALGAVAGYGGVIANGPRATMYLSIVVFFLTLVTGAAIMNGIEKKR